MNFGVEGRLPFLDHRIVELASACDKKELIRRNQRKWILRRAVEGRVGSDTAWKKKVPFLMNVAENLELRKRGLAAAEALKSRGLLNSDLDASIIGPPHNFLTGKRLFALDALETWIRSYEIEV
jgi:asparagine synthase (glutamine-hydrolysing)